MMNMLKQYINRWRSQRRDQKHYDYFLHRLTNLSLKDNINSLPNPEKKMLRILGNGDSLKQMINQLDDSCDYMVSNAHVLHPSYKELKPRYYVLADPAFFHPRANFNGLDIMKKILNDTTWSMTLFVPEEHTRNVTWLQSTEHVNIMRVNEAIYIGPEEHRQYCYDHNLAMPEVNNVLALAIYLGIYMRYQTIELYGVEHSWTRDIYVNADNHTCMRDSHFYDKKEVDENVIIDGDGRPMKFHEVLRLYASYFPAYWELREIADRKCVHILNRSLNSFIDAFEKKR